MKRSGFTLKIITVTLFLWGAVALIFALLPKEAAAPVKNIADISASDPRDSSLLFCQELDVVQRYAFETVDEYYDSESGYSDVTYRVYTGAQPMDKYDLHSEYYIVRFRDKTGTEYVTSMSVYADSPDRTAFLNAPVTLPACVSTPAISQDSPLMNSNDKELIALREAALDAYSRQENIPRAEFLLHYRAGSAEEYRQDFEQEASADKVRALVFAVIFLGCGIFSLCLRRKKAKKAAA